MKKRTFISLLTMLPISTIGCFSCSNSPKISALKLITPKDLSTNLKVNEEYTSSAFDVEINPTSILKDKITWHTDNSEIANFNTEHKLVIKPIQTGELKLKVWVESKYDASVKDEKTLIFNVDPQIESIKLITPSDLSTNLKVNEEYTSSAFDVEINPTSISKDKVTWHTDNSEIANFNTEHKLVIKPTQTGELKLKVWVESKYDASVKDEKTLTFNVGPEIESIQLITPGDLPIDLMVNKEYTSSVFYVEINPTSISKDTITWHTDNSEIANFNTEHKLVIKPTQTGELKLKVWVESKYDASVKDEKTLIFNVNPKIEYVKLIVPTSLPTNLIVNKEYTSSYFGFEIYPTSISSDMITWHTDKPKIANFNAQHQLVIKPTQTGELKLKVWVESKYDASVKDEKTLIFNVNPKIEYVKLIVPTSLPTSLPVDLVYRSSPFDVTINPASISKDTITWHTDYPGLVNFNAQHQLIVTPITIGALQLKVWVESKDDASVKDEITWTFFVS